MGRPRAALPGAGGAAAVAFALGLCILPLSYAASVTSPNQTCLSHGEEAREAGAVARAARVLLVWESAPARAAAALLRAALLAAGHEPRDVIMERSSASRDLCTLLDAGLASKGVAVVGVAVRWAAGSARCAWLGRSLGVVGEGAAPLAPRLHARLARRYGRSPACGATALQHIPYLRDAAALRDCGFLPSGTEGEYETNATVYVLEGEWESETRELRAQLDGGGARLRFRALGRAALAARVAGAEHSFLFFDAELWDEESGVSPLPAPAGASQPPVSLLVADREALLEHAPALYLLLERNFAPHASDLRAVLELGRPVEDAACERAPGAAGYGLWREAAMRTSQRFAVAIVCNTEPHEDYNDAVERIALYHLDNATGLSALKARLYPKVVYVDCGDPSALAVEIVKWHSSGFLWRTVGAAAPAEQAARAAANAETVRLPLLAYTPATAAGVRSATGTPEQLALALRRLLAACGWRRLGLVSEKTPLARAVADALRGAEGLLTYEARAEAPDEAVRELRDRDTRVFFVNGDAATAARVLAAAAREAAPPGRHVWIVRDYPAPDPASAALRPLSVSFQWRGEDAPAARGLYLNRLELAWRNRTWPRHAASILDALITLGQGFERLITEHEETLDYPDMENKLSYFWSGVQHRNISGVVEDLKYDADGVMAARVYVHRWEGAVRPRRLLVWRAGEGPARGDLCPAADRPRDDGAARCLAPSGDRYRPVCLDGVWISGAAALAAAAVALALAAVAGRRWLARRDRRLERATTARILAQREAAFADLAPHLVDRAALLLAEELGAGRFGRVRRGEVRRGAGPRRRPAPVAVKALRDGASPTEESQFLREARLLAALDHEHVVRFEGVCWEGGPPLLLMELALFGDLLRYLRARRHLAEGAAGEGGEGAAGPEEAAAVSSEALTRLAREAAEALAYLGSRGLVHRDVRAANCLVDARRSLKLADFGLARETGAAGGEYACRGRALFPVLWMAPESLARGVATAASDTWSFGVLALELVTLGARPFGAAAPEAAVRAVLAGGRPPLPRDACAETRAMALACWRREPAARPPAAQLAAWLARRSTALRPALAPDLEEPDCDSGIGEPDPRPHAYRGPPSPLYPDIRRSFSLLTLDT